MKNQKELVCPHNAMRIHISTHNRQSIQNISLNRAHELLSMCTLLFITTQIILLPRLMPVHAVVLAAHAIQSQLIRYLSDLYWGGNQ